MRHEPLHVLHPVPAGHHQPQREAVLGRQRRAVHLVGQQGALGVGRRYGALVALLGAALHAAVEPAEQHLHGLRAQAGLGQQRRERRARPLRGAHGLGQPGLADRPRLEQRAAVAGALEGHRQRHPLARPQLVEREAERALHRAADLEPEGGRVHDRDVVVDQQVVQPGRREVVAQGLERERVVARREPQLLRRDPALRDRACGRGVHGRRVYASGRQRTTGRLAAPASSRRRTGVV